METSNRKRRKMSFTTVGGSSILTIFAVLCFVVFALLSLSTATANHNLTKKSTEAVTNYYKADTEAEEILAKIRAGEQPEGVKLYRAEKTDNGVKRIIAEGIGYVDWDAFATYHCKIDDNQDLECEVLLRFGGGESSGYQIVRWQKVYTGDWEPDTSLPVFDPERDQMPGTVTIDE